MKRVIICAVFLWMLLILLSYRLTAQDSVDVYVAVVKGNLTTMQLHLRQPQSRTDSMVRREVMRYNGQYFLSSSAVFEYYSCRTVCFAVWTPAAVTLSATRKRGAFNIGPF